MPTTSAIYREITRRVNQTYRTQNVRGFAVQYYIALQVLVDSLGVDILDILDQLFPEATRNGVTFTQDHKWAVTDGIVEASHSLGGVNVASCLARIIFFAHAMYDLEIANVDNLQRVKNFCTSSQLKKRPFERTYYEIVVAAKFARRAREVEFVQENTRKTIFHRKTKTPDFLVLDRSNWISVECKSNVFKDLDSITVPIIRTKRATDRFKEACTQVQEYGEVTGRHGIIFVQYFDNRYVQEDKEDMRDFIIDEIRNYRFVEGGGFTYDVFDKRFVHATTEYFGAVKDPQFFSPGMLRALSFQNPIETEVWSEHSFDNWPYNNS